MIRRLRRRWQGGKKDEKGAVLILVTLMVFVLLAMAAFSVDLAWLYLQSTQTQKAAEAAALAAVVHMPTDLEPMGAGANFFSGQEPYDAAASLAAEHGRSLTQVRRWATAAQVRTDMQSQVGTFFMRVFGINTVTINRHAIAEQLPPLKLGSDEPVLGGAAYDFWVAVNGEERAKEDGDPFSTRCLEDMCSPAGANTSFRNPSFFYALDVGAGDVGTSLGMYVFDGPPNKTGADEPLDIYSGTPNDWVRFRIFEPDASPGDPTDNSNQICSKTYSFSSPGNNSWNAICSFTPGSEGIHVVAVEVGGDDNAINGFALGTNGGDSAVYGLGFMSLWMHNSGSSPVLKVVKVEEVYAGTELIISAFDLGDINDPGGSIDADVTFGGELATFDCQVRVSDHNGTPDGNGWVGDDNPGSAPCKLTTKNSSDPGAADSHQGRYNNEWVEFRFNVPSDYSCSSDCWGTVTYTFSSGSPIDRTTWGARINGTPIHLLRDSLPSS